MTTSISTEAFKKQKVKKERYYIKQSGQTDKVSYWEDIYSYHKKQSN